MAYTLSGALAACLVLTATLGALAQTPDRAAAQNGRAAPFAMSPECRMDGAAVTVEVGLAATAKAFLAKRSIRILAIGSSSTVGIGASSPAATYPVRLEADLEGYFKNREIEVVARGVSGEIAEAAAQRMRYEVAETRPDLVVWQVGTNDALARVDIDDFADTLRSTLMWLDEHDIDVVLIDPQYVERLAQDRYYAQIVSTVQRVAREEGVPLVSRYSFMHDHAEHGGARSYLSGDMLHLNDLGYRCMAEQVAGAIVAGTVAPVLTGGPATPPEPRLRNVTAPAR